MTDEETPTKLLSLKEAIAKAKTSKKKFDQGLELFINFRNIDFAKTDNKINLEVILPKGRGRERKIAVVAGPELAVNAKKSADKVIMGNEIERIGKDKKEVKKLANEYYAFISQADLMPSVGKWFGQALGPRGKMPKPVPPSADVGPLVSKLKNTVTIRTKGKNLPVLHVPFGTQAMSDEDLEANAKAVISGIKSKLPTPDQNIKQVFVKTTMGPVIPVDPTTV